MHQDEKVLSYGDSLLRVSDVSLLEDGKWLNDKIIGFVYEYFEREKFGNISTDICFVSPEVTQFVKLAKGSDEVGIFLQPLKLEKKKFIFFPVNDNQEADSSGGSHWSLLVYNRNDNIFLYYDSMHGSNINYAMQLKEKLKDHVKDSTNAKIVQQDCPRQNNGHDCGMYVLCFTEEICYIIQDQQKPSFHIKFDASRIKNERTRFKTLIESLSQRFQ